MFYIDVPKTFVQNFWVTWKVKQCAFLQNRIQTNFKKMYKCISKQKSCILAGCKKIITCPGYGSSILDKRTQSPHYYIFPIRIMFYLSFFSHCHNLYPMFGRWQIYVHSDCVCVTSLTNWNIAICDHKREETLREWTTSTSKMNALAYAKLLVKILIYKLIISPLWGKYMNVIKCLVLVMDSLQIICLSHILGEFCLSWITRSKLKSALASLNQWGLCLS